MLTIRAARRRRLVALFGCLLLAVTCAAAVTATLGETFSVVTPARIMPLGDSITRGGGSSWGDGFRTPLVQRMVVARYTSDLVGPVNNGPPWLYDRNHGGWGGYGINDIALRVVGDLNTYRPNYVLLMIGSNDVQWNYHLDTAPDRLSALIDQITGTLPTAQVVVASITPLKDPVMDANARLYNAAIPGIVEAKAAAGQHVSFVDMYPVITLNDLTDNVHPNDAGYAKLAAAWAQAVAGVRPTPPAVSARTCPCSIWAPGDAPTTPQVTTTSAAEVGVKFRTEKAGFITGVRFYKGPDNAGPHEARLWKAKSDASGYDPNTSTSMSATLLATGTVTSGTSSGWQDVVFATPVPVEAHTLYFATYYAPFGRYAADPGYFRDREIVNSPVRLPSQGSIEGNGFIRSGSAGLPQPNPQADTNYWVDVVFMPASPSTTATLTATAVSASRIDLSWSAVADTTGYRLERSPDGTSWSTLGSVAAGVTSYTDTGLAAETTYYYRVIAVSNGVESAPSAPASATTQAVPPAAPSSVTATAVSSTQINVAWSGVSNATGYRVERSSDGAAWAAIVTTSAGVTAYSNTDLQAASTYYYRVVASNAAGDSAPSTVATATTQPPPATPPQAPTSLTATVVSSARIDLAWSDVTSETGYRVERSSGGGNWAAIAMTAENVTSYADTGLAPATTYSYRVVAVNGTGASSPSPVASATTFGDSTPPTAPTALKAASAKNKVNLSWAGSTDAGGSGMSGYRVWRSTSGASGVFATVATIGAASTSYSDAAVTGNVNYWYRVTAVDGAGNQSQPSNTVLATPK